MRATIIIKEMQYEVKIGVQESEREVPQPIFFDLELIGDVTNALEKQDIEQTINYSTIQKKIGIFLENKEYILVEKLANDVTEILMKEFPKIEELTLTCWKPQALAKKNVKNVGVRVVKKRI